MVASRSHTVADLEYAFKSFAVPSPVILREGPAACTLYSLTARPAVPLARDPSQLLLFSYLWTTVLKKNVCSPGHASINSSVGPYPEKWCGR
jgi:hypothetical protein